ncbi:CAP domain-containing protein [Nocardioides sp. AX2bis]|uniref:CAP domain-containing protein n=1 Tax=Nocardioides sp. AX2bis TaxID=2653157 RepID=UPI0012F3AEE9|nr:CAP domain-containing protein [Nocardioides sp. AX2bis]VXB92515.1 conserved exported hypothetical protein [Nocardioides sp. AX2bis]
MDRLYPVHLIHTSTGRPRPTVVPCPPPLRPLLAASALTTALTAGLLAATPAADAAPADRYARAAVTATNAARADHDRARLHGQACLQRKARSHARDMAQQERMFHQDLGPVLRDCGMNAVGENVAVGYTSGRAVVRGWMGSEGHRANILNPTFRRVAVAAAKDGDGTWYAAQVFGRRA